MTVQAHGSLIGSWTGLCIRLDCSCISKTEYLNLYFQLIQQSLVNQLALMLDIKKQPSWVGYCWYIFRDRAPGAYGRLYFRRWPSHIPVLQCDTDRPPRRSRVYALPWPFETEWTIVSASANSTYQKWHYVLPAWFCLSLDMHLQNIVNM